MESSHLLQPEPESVPKPEAVGDKYSFDALALPTASGSTPSEEAWSRARARHRIWHRIARLYRKALFRRQPSNCCCWSRRSFWRILSKVVTCLVVGFLLASFSHGVLNPSYSNPPDRYLALAENVASSSLPGRGNVRNEKVLIAANIINKDLIRGAWGKSLLSLVDLLGHDNVFISVYENDSGSGTRDALLDLQQRLSCNSSVVTGAHMPLSMFPTVLLPNGEERVQRLTYLAEVRNRLLRPIDVSFAHDPTPGFQSAVDVQFDKILFLNDVYFSPLDAVQLLFSTNAESGEAQYRAACAIDQVQFFKLYDTFVVRDTDGYSLSLQYYPWFTNLGSGTSRADVLQQSDAVRVRSCWGGMAAFNATLFQPDPAEKISLTNQLSESTSLGLPGLPIQFRSAEEPFWEAAECCLLYADIEEEFGRPSLDDGGGVFINPYIRTAYSVQTWNWMAFFRRIERFTEYYQYLVTVLKHPEQNQRQFHEPGDMVDEIVWTTPAANDTTKGHPGKGQFSLIHRKARPGGFCGQRRLFVMKNNLEAANKAAGSKNWDNIRIPWWTHYPAR